MPDHHRVHAAGEVAKDGQLVRIERGAREVDGGQFVMGVDGRARVAGEMLAAGAHALGAQAIVESPGVRDDLLHVIPIAAAAQGIIGLVVGGMVAAGLLAAARQISANSSGGPNARGGALWPNRSSQCTGCHGYR